MFAFPPDNPPKEPGRKRVIGDRYPNPQASFSDVLAYVRQHLWTHTQFPTARLQPYSENIPDSLLDLWQDILCYAS